MTETQRLLAEVQTLEQRNAELRSQLTLATATAATIASTTREPSEQKVSAPVSATSTEPVEPATSNVAIGDTSVDTVSTASTALGVEEGDAAAAARREKKRLRRERLAKKRAALQADADA